MSLIGAYHASTIFCKFWTIIVCVSIAVSVFSMVAIAVDRFYAIVFPMKPALFSKKTCRRLIIIIWIVSVVTEGFYFEMYCDECFQKISFLLLFGITAFVLTVLYSIIIVFLYRQKMDLHLASETVRLRAKENRKITSMLVLMVIAFYLVWIPFHVYNFQEKDVVNHCSWDWPKWIAGTLSLFYTVINSLVFVIFNETFREGCRELLCCPWFCTKCNACSLTSFPREGHANSAPHSNQQNHAVENVELQRL